MSNECTGLFGKIFGHNYQARMNKSEAPMDFEARGDIVAIIEATKSTTYVCDICTRCGDRVKNE